ncbi:MAG: hypothetical protein ILO34_04500 [Kiritimatiellae bacterium]|nr:hypothetical protein [Kiritimatiellia bacterium]
MKTRHVIAIAFAAAIAFDASAWTVRPGLQQAKGRYDTSDYYSLFGYVPSDFDQIFVDAVMPLEVVPGTMMSEVQCNESYGHQDANYTSPYSGAVYHWDFGEGRGGWYMVTYYAYRGQIWMDSSKSYAFAKRFSDYAAISIDGTEILKSTVQTDFATATYRPQTTGWHDFEVLLVGNNDSTGEGQPWESKGAYDRGIGMTGGISSQTWGTAFGLGLAWNDTGTCNPADYSNSQGEWLAIRDSGDASALRYVDGQEEIILPCGFERTQAGYRISARVLGGVSGKMKIAVDSAEKTLAAGDDGSGWEYVSEEQNIDGSGVAVFEVPWSGADPYFAFEFDGVDRKGPSVAGGSRTFRAGGSFGRTITNMTAVKAHGGEPAKIVLSFNDIGAAESNTLYVAWGVRDGGGIMGEWGDYKAQAVIPGDTTSYEFSDFPAGWGTTVYNLRFFLADGVCLSYWKQLSYIAGNCSQATLDTGYVPSLSTRIDLDYVYLYGRGDNWVLDNKFMFCDDGSFLYRHGYDDLVTTATYKVTPSVYTDSNSILGLHFSRNHFEFGNHYVWDFAAGNYLFNMSPASGYEFAHPLKFMKQWNYGRIYSIKIREGGTPGNAGDALAADMIPVLDWSGEACMYDRVRGVFVRNCSASGSFACGGETVAESDGYNIPVAMSSTIDFAELAPGSDAADGCRKCIEFTVSGYAGTSTLGNFPVLVRLSEGAYGFSYGDMASADGDDLIFTDLQGNVLPFEIEKWDAGGTSLVWVGVPALFNGARFRLFYSRRGAVSGSSGTVWTAAGYVSVMHLDETSGSAVAADATGNGIAAVPTRGTNEWLPDCQMYSEEGVLGLARNNGYASPQAGGWFLLAPNYESLLDSVSTFTVSCFFRFQSASDVGNVYLFSNKNGGGECDYGWQVISEWRRTTWLVVGPAWSYTYYYPDDPAEDWVHMAFAFGGDSVSMYSNGSATALNSATRAPTATENGLGIGNYPNGEGTTPFGAYDEIRIRKYVSTPDWVKAEYDTITDASFLSSTGARTMGQPGLVLMVR